MVPAIDDAVPETRIRIAGDLQPPEIREPVEQKACEKDQPAAAEDLRNDFARLSLAKREMRRHADDEKEEREDEIGRRPSIPRSVIERRVAVVAAGIVHQ